MFCSKCGSAINDGEKFCTNCGALVSQNGGTTAPNYQQAPAQPVPMNPIIEKFIAVVKTFFSKKMQSGIEMSVKSNTWEGALFALINILVTGLSFPLLFRSAGGNEEGFFDAVSYGSLFGRGLLIGLISVVFLTVAVFVSAKFLLNANISFAGALNLSQYAALPVVVAMLVGMLLGLIYFPLWAAVLCGAFLMKIVMTFMGVKRLENSAPVSVVGYAAITAIACVIIAVLSYLVMKEDALEIVLYYAISALLK